MFKLGLVALTTLFLSVPAALTPRRADQPSRTTQEPSRKRKVIDTTDNSIPVAITAVNNIDKDTWIDDLEFEVQNRSSRPIYHVMIVITFPDLPKNTDLDGVPRSLVVVAQYGRKDFAVHPGEMTNAQDVPIKPGEKALLKMAISDANGLKSYLKKYNMPPSVISHLRMRIEQLSFGDGSGYRIGSVPFYPRSSSNRGPPAAPRGDGTTKLVKASYIAVQFGC